MGLTKRRARFVTRAKSSPIPQNSDRLPVEKEIMKFEAKKRVLEFSTWDGRLVMSVERPFAYGT